MIGTQLTTLCQKLSPHELSKTGILAVAGPEWDHFNWPTKIGVRHGMMVEKLWCRIQVLYLWKMFLFSTRHVHITVPAGNRGNGPFCGVLRRVEYRPAWWHPHSFVDNFCLKRRLDEKKCESLSFTCNWGEILNLPVSIVPNYIPLGQLDQLV